MTTLSPVDCPACPETVSPSLPDVIEATGESRLRGTEFLCSNCGHPLCLYYF